MKNYIILIIAITLFASCQTKEKEETTQTVFPYMVSDVDADSPMSAAMKRSFHEYPSPLLAENELYSQFKYTKLKGFDYNGGDGTITRRDPSKVLLENGKYYVWYTKRATKVRPIGLGNAKNATEEIPSADWDLSEIWYATSEDGFTWEEQGVAVTRPAKPIPGFRSVATPDILKWKGKFYLYYQAFSETPGLKGDDCVASVSYADSPDGPWIHYNKVVLPTGPKGSWDQFTVQAPTPLIHNNKVYMYYKVDFNRPIGNRVGYNGKWSAIGLAISENPLGPFEKHPLNPVQNSGHEICLFPFKEGVASLTIRDGNEHFTIQYAKDWVNFEIESITEMMPIGPNAFIPDAFADNGDGRGITWGVCHFRNVKGSDGKYYSELARFDCDLSLDVHDPEMKKFNNLWSPDIYYKLKLSKAQRERIQKENRERIIE
ncbi:glycoside hydrolase family 117 protein [Lutibacter citreus]|uniref:glycoside hydrolase family 117 protein n=1 Tax=Lutibacter citreus TaxID=2138210 RepID=UPI000DBE323E|nr:glycoside hydrolase [Lutibacter citreus]